jgi:3'-phosphoadenosine 5'-phosphosulfate sulfotransferase (PAPS reductase)/FAD synthetase
LTNLFCFFGGKDSITLVRLAQKLFPAKIPFPLLHVDTGHNPETIEFRDKLVAELGLELCAMYKTRLIKEKWLKKPENIPAETACKPQHFRCYRNLNLRVLVERVVTRKSRAKERIFRCVMILVNGISVLNYSIC